MIPKIEFRYSSVYDRNYRNLKYIQNYLKEKNQKYPSKKEILFYIEKSKKLWEKNSKKILQEISKISGLDWKEKRIICYIVGVGRPFSDPLTIRTYGKNIKKFIETLTHELIHQIFIQNKNIYKKWHEYILEKYKNEKRITKTHILLSAIHWELLKKLEGIEAVKKEIKKYENSPDYKRAWKIVEKETSKKIIKKFIKIIK